MRNIPVYAFYWLRNKLFLKAYYERNSHHIHTWAGRNHHTAESYNKLILNCLQSEKPFLVGRCGTTELSCMRAFDFKMKKVYTGMLYCMSRNSGFFPQEEECAFAFTELMKTVMGNTDVYGFLPENLSDYYVSRYTPKSCQIVDLRFLTPFHCEAEPWTLGLKGKKVLVISPFADTIRLQHRKLSEMFYGREIMPKFQLETVKAVQTIAGNADSRFATWFEALDYMYSEALKKDFDVALIGCGAYGYPLGAKLKDAGKQAIVLGGMTQALFGIRCKRFDEASDYQFLRNYYTENWVYPSEHEIPSGYTQVEGGAYWK